jgi:hypothetical protein
MDGAFDAALLDSRSILTAFPPNIDGSLTNRKSSSRTLQSRRVRTTWAAMRRPQITRKLLERAAVADVSATLMTR